MNRNRAGSKAGRHRSQKAVKDFSEAKNMILAEFVKETCGELNLSNAVLQKVAVEFETAMRDGLEGKPSSLRMLPSFISRPTGRERGEAIAIDFGGTNVRVLKVRLEDGKSRCEKVTTFSLKDPGGAYDYTGEQIRAEELFDFIVRHVAEVAGGGGAALPLGHTFSFPCRQEGINRAVLIQWTKEIRTSGVEGRDVTPLLEEALARQGVRNVRPRAILNDTVGTLLAAAYTLRDAEIGSICGTGHNTCYLEPRHPLTGKPMIVNTEAGNFDKVALTRFDREVNEASARPGAMLLEKQVSGAYLGEVVLAVLRAMTAERLLPAPTQDWSRGILTGVHLAQILQDGSGYEHSKQASETLLGLSGLAAEQLRALQMLVESVVARSARLVGATYGAILRYLDPDLGRNHVVAVDGSLYAHMPGYEAGIRAGLEGVLGEGARSVDTCWIRDGSGIGAAIAATVADTQA
jgi:hexokinase